MMQNKLEGPENTSARGDYSQISPDVTEADFLCGRIGYALGFNSTNQTMVDLWSEGFALSAPLTATNELGRYCQAREQLAAYMRKRILEEYIAFGCAPAVCAWYDDALEERRETIVELAARAIGVSRGKLKKPNTGFVAMDKFLTDPYHIEVEEAHKAREAEAATAPATFGSTHASPAAVDYVCAVTGEASTVIVKFIVDRWGDMELALGQELPKLLKGWQRFRLPVKHRTKSRYDAVGMVGTPIEHCVQAYYQGQREVCEEAGLNLAQEIQYLSAFNPNITIGFSEKGLLRVWKKLGL